MEESFEVEYKYVQLVQDLEGPRLKEFLVLESLLGQAFLPGFSQPWSNAGTLTRTKLVPSPELSGPFDGKNSRGEPLITDEAKIAVLSRRGLSPKTNPAGIKLPSRPPSTPPQGRPPGR
jgi:hypothetical protein